jgi:sulfhydrogenase subunit alpha
MEVKIAPISRVVGHITLNMKIEGDDVKAELKVLNDPRFIEALVVGRRYDEVPEIVSRICGPCSVNHTLASIVALENALGVKPSEDVELLRELLCHGVNIQNQAVHLYFLALPDLVGCENIVDLVRKHPAAAKTGLELKTYGNRLIEAVAGRVVHPTACVVGGFTETPSHGKINQAIRMLEESRKHAVEAADLFLGFETPELEPVSDLHLVTCGQSEYPFIGSSLSASDGTLFASSDYTKFIEELPQPYTTAKYCMLNGSSFYVGSRARLNVYAKGLAESAGEYVSRLKLPLRNPFENIPAKAIETLHSVERSIEILNSIKDRRLKTKSDVSVSAGEGVGTLEAPRGVLIHDSKVDEKGIVNGYNVITPTALNGKQS